MKKITMILVLVTLGFLMAPFASAQLNDRAVWTAKVPYSFQVENTKMPAGEYRLQWVGGRIRIESLDGKHVASVITLPMEGKMQPNSILQFTSYGTERFLSGVWFAGQEQGRELLKSKVEVELAKKQTPVQLAVVIVR